ncbi:MAG: hypothetical protein ACP5I1_19365, partial [Candidatus Hinthialibacter sp.]
MIDSGGFQLLNAELKGKPIQSDPNKPMQFKDAINLAPKHVIETSILCNAQFVIGLNIPIQKINAKNTLLREREFKNKLQKNVCWSQEMCRLRKQYCPYINLLIPIQCYNINQFYEFVFQLDGFDFDGFSLPCRNMNLNEIADFMLHIYLLGFRSIHFMGVAAYSAIALAAYLA